MWTHYNSQTNSSILAYSVTCYRWKAQYCMSDYQRTSRSLKHLLEVAGRFSKKPTAGLSNSISQFSSPFSHQALILLPSHFIKTASHWSHNHKAATFLSSISHSGHITHLGEIKTPPKPQTKPFPQKSRKIICIWRTTCRSSAVGGCRTDWPNCFRVLGFKPDVLTGECLSRRREEMHQVKCEKMGSVSFWHLW